MRVMRNRIIGVAVAVLAASAAWAQTSQVATPVAASGLELSRRIVANPGEPGHDAAGYLRVSNRGKEDRLIGVSCPCADRVELHRIDRSGPRPDMVSDAEWSVPGGGALEVRPGGNLHLMLMNFDPAKSVDGKVSLELTFRDAGKVRADFALTRDSKAAWQAFEPNAL